MAMASSSFPSFTDLGDSVGAIDLNTLGIASSFGELYLALSSIDNDTLLGGTEISGPFPGGRFTAVGGFFNRSGAIRTMDLFWTDATLHADVAVDVKRNGEYFGFVTGLSYETPQLSFELRCRATAGGHDASLSSLAIDVGERSYLLKGKMSVNLNTGHLGGTISSIEIDDGLAHATITKLKLSVLRFIEQAPAKALPYLLSGNDQLTASADSVELKGFNGKDRITGSAGNDTLSGGSGADKLTGGRGADHFVIDVAPNGGKNADLITDFSASEGDRIVFDAPFFTEQNFVAVFRLKDKHDIHGGAFNSASYRGVVYEAATGRLFYDAHSDGAGEKIATLIGKPELSAEDIVIASAG